MTIDSAGTGSYREVQISARKTLANDQQLFASYVRSSAEGELNEFARTFVYASRGCGPFLHTNPDDRPEDVFGGQVTLHCGGGRDSYLLLPIVPRL